MHVLRLGLNIMVLCMCRDYAREAARVPVDALRGKKCREFVDFVLHGSRFVCARGLRANRNQDHSASFVRLRTGEWCRVEKGLELDLETHCGGCLKILAVVPYPVLDRGALGIKPVVLNNNPASHGAMKFVKMQDISTPAVTVLKPRGDTATGDAGKRIALPALPL